VGVKRRREEEAPGRQRVVVLVITSFLRSNHSRYLRDYNDRETTLVNQYFDHSSSIFEHVPAQVPSDPAQRADSPERHHLHQHRLLYSHMLELQSPCPASMPDI
jgi:hypothetical protein